MPSSIGHCEPCEFGTQEPAKGVVGAAESAAVHYQVYLLELGLSGPQTAPVEQALVNIRQDIGPQRMMAALACAHSIASGRCPIFRSLLSVDKTTAIILEKETSDGT